MSRLTMAALLLAPLLTGGAAAQQPAPDADIQMIALDGELQAHSEMGVTDVYKFLYQGIFGPGHAIENRDAATRYLGEEMANLRPVEIMDPLCQPLGGDPSMVRIHLRPFAAGGGDQSVLLDAFVSSAESARPDPTAMEKVLDRAVTRLIRRNRYQLAGQLEDLAGTLAEENYPPVHHSDKYVAAYSPAYRVILGDIAQQHGWCQ